MSKYHATKTEIDGIVFDSKKEAGRYAELKLLERAREISNLQRQVRFELIGKQAGERAVYYVADFTYIDKGGRLVVEDTKGYKTKDYIIKRKLFKSIYGNFDFREV